MIAEMTNINPPNKKAKRRSNGNSTRVRHKGLPIALYNRIVYTPQTANKRDPKRIRAIAASDATIASPTLMFGANVCGMAKRSAMDRFCKDFPQS